LRNSRDWKIGRLGSKSRPGPFVFFTAFDAKRLTDDELLRFARQLLGQGCVYAERGWTLSVMGRYDEEVDAFEAGLIVDARNDDEVAGQLLLQTARAETLLGMHDAALEHALAPERIFSERDDPRGLASTLRIIGDAHRDAGRPDEAAQALRRGLALAERVGSAEEIGACLINLGLAEKEHGELAAAVACDRRAIEEFEGNNGSED
jgi:tetratricopeptide (TPR) repeat protein